MFFWLKRNEFSTTFQTEIHEEKFRTFNNGICFKCLQHGIPKKTEGAAKEVENTFYIPPKIIIIIVIVIIVEGEKNSCSSSHSTFLYLLRSRGTSEQKSG